LGREKKGCGGGPGRLTFARDGEQGTGLGGGLKAAQRASGERTSKGGELTRGPEKKETRYRLFVEKKKGSRVTKGKKKKWQACVKKKKNLKNTS